MFRLVDLACWLWIAASNVKEPSGEAESDGDAGQPVHACGFRKYDRHCQTHAAGVSNIRQVVTPQRVSVFGHYAVRLAASGGHDSSNQMSSWCATRDSDPLSAPPRYCDSAESPKTFLKSSVVRAAGSSRIRFSSPSSTEKIPSIVRAVT